MVNLHLPVNAELTGRTWEVRTNRMISWSMQQARGVLRLSQQGTMWVQQFPHLGLDCVWFA